DPARRARDAARRGEACALARGPSALGAPDGPSWRRVRVCPRGAGRGVTPVASGARRVRRHACGRGWGRGPSRVRLRLLLGRDRSLRRAPQREPSLVLAPRPRARRLRRRAGVGKRAREARGRGDRPVARGVVADRPRAEGAARVRSSQRGDRRLARALVDRRGGRGSSRDESALSPGSPGRRRRYSAVASTTGASAGGGMTSAGTTVTSHERSRSSTTSSCWIESSRLLLLMPSVSIVMQNGQALATVFAPVSRSCSVRFTFTRSLFCSSIHICAPPAPQQSPRCLVQYSGSTSSTPGIRRRISRGGSYTPLYPPREQ